MKTSSTNTRSLASASLEKSLRRLALLGAGASFAFTSAFTTQAATVTKANNTNNLNLTSSWVGAVIPGAGDIVLWDGTVISANSVVLGANTNWLGLQLTNPGGAVTIGAGNTLTLGTSGITMSAATQDLTINAALTLAQGGQTWNVATGRTLTTSAFTRSAGATLIIDKSVNTGTITASPTLTNGILSYAAVKTAGTAANNTAAGWNWATVSGGNLVAFTGASVNNPASPVGGDLNGTLSATVNYDVGSATTVNRGTSPSVNTARFTAASGTSTLTTNANAFFGSNGFMTAGGVTFQMGNAANQFFQPSDTTRNEMVLFAGVGPINVGGTIRNNGSNAATITIAGPGTVTITGTGGGTYTGATNVNNGTFVVSGASAINTSSSLTINGIGAKYLHTSSTASTVPITLTRGTLDGTGAVGAVTVSNGLGAILANGNGGTSALTMSSLAFGGGATVNASLGGATPIVVTGALATTPANGTVTINVSGSLNTGFNNIISYGSFSGGLASNFTLGTLPALNARQSSGGIVLNGNNVAVNILGDLPAWSGANGGVWTTATTGDNTGPNNWALKTGHALTNFWVSDTVEFNDTVDVGGGPVAPTTTTVTIQGGSVSPNATTFNNSALAYTVATSDGSGISSGSLVKNGTGLLTLTTNNTYTGVTTINAGTLRLGDGTTDGSLSTTGNVTNNASLVYNLVGNSPLYTGVISGTGSVTKTGNGMVQLNATNTYSGGTTISAGTLQVGANNTSPAENPSTLGTGTVTVQTGATLQFAPGSTGATFNFANNFVLDGGTITGVDGVQKFATGTLQTINVTANGGTIQSEWATKDVYLVGQLTGSGPLTIRHVPGIGQNSAVFIGNASNTYSGTLTLNAVAQNLTNVGEQIQLQQNTALQNATVNVVGTNGANSGLVFVSITTPILGALAGNGNVALTSGVTLSTGNNNSSSTYSGILSGLGGLTKVGTGTFSLTAAQTYTGTTTVSSGTLRLGDGTTDGSLASPTIVNNAAFVYNNAGLVPDYAGVISGIGTLTKAGSGNQTLTGTHTYTGATSVTGGSLIISGGASINSSSGIAINGSGARFVQNSATALSPAVTVTQGFLDGTQTISGPVTVGAGTGGIITNGNGTSSTLTMNTLTFLGAGQFTLIPAGGSPTPTAPVVVGTLNSTGAAGALTINLAPLSPFLNGSTYKLLGYTTFAGNISEFALGTGLSSRQATGSSLANDTVNKFITLTVNGDNPAWSGVGSGVWTTAATNDNTGPNDWALKTAHTATNFWASDVAEFNDTVDLGAGPVAPTTTAVTIQGGNVSPGITLFNNSSLNYTISSSDGSGIASGSVTKNGSGTVTISTANTYTGLTTINAGTLQIGDGFTDGSIANTSGITDNGSLVYNLSGAQTYGGVISGAGSVTMSGVSTGLLTLGAANTFSGGVNINGATLKVASATALGLVTNKVNFGLSSFGTLQINGVAVTVGGLTGGDGTAAVENGAATNATLTINSATDSTYAGVIRNGFAGGTVGLTKTGTAKQTLSGASTYTGLTTVTNGTLSVSGSLGSTAVALSGGTLSLEGAAALTSNVLTISGTGTLVETVDNAIGGTTSINFQKNVTISRPNTYSGDNTINTGNGITITATDRLALGTGRINFATGSVNAVAQLHIDGGGIISMPVGLGGNSGLNDTIDVNNNGSGANGVIQLNGVVSSLGNVNLNVTGGNGYSLYVNQLASNAGSGGTTTFNPTTASMSVGTITSTTNFTKTYTLGGTATGNSITGSLGGTGTLSVVVTGSWTLSGSNSYANGTTIGVSQGGGTLTVDNDNALGSGALTFDLGGNASTAKLALVNGHTLSNAINFTARGSSTNAAIENVSGNNTLSGAVAFGAGGSDYPIQSDAGVLTMSGPLTYAGTSAKTIDLLGAGDGVISGVITNSGTSTLDITKGGTGTWTLAATESNVRNVTVNNGSLNVTASQTLAALNIGAGSVVTFGDGAMAFDFGDAFSSGGSDAGLSGAVAVVPEPGSMGLLLLGALGLAARRRREAGLEQVTK